MSPTTRGTERLAGVLVQCIALAHLNLSHNDIDTVAEGRLRASCGVVKSLALFCRDLTLLALYQLFTRQATRRAT
jgi:hypothetical protein